VNVRVYMHRRCKVSRFDLHALQNKSPPLFAQGDRSPCLPIVSPAKRHSLFPLHKPCILHRLGMDNNVEVKRRL